MEAIVRNMPWVNITMRMELGEQTEYENEIWAKLTLLNPSIPEALNFVDDMTTMSINAAVAGGALYTNAFSAFMGDTVNAPREVDSQESDILEESDDKSIKDNLIDNNLEGIISNMEAVQRTQCTADTAAPKRTPQKVSQTANT